MPSYEWDVFICHASEDKEPFVRQLAEALEAEGLSVWYDDFELTVGDSLRRSIDDGLSKSRYGIVVLSEVFFSKQWTQKELDGLVSRESEGRKVILPVWFDVSDADVKEYSPMLSGLVAAKAAQGLEQVVSDLLDAVQPGQRPSGARGLRASEGESLAQEERESLLAAVDGDGYLLSAGYKGGHTIRAGERLFTENADDRTIENYKWAVRKLVERGYLEPQGSRNEVFKVTHEGYEVTARIEGNAGRQRTEPPDWYAFSGTTGGPLARLSRMT